MTRIALRPKHPERICWGCEKYCPAEDLACGNGTIRTPHPVELFGHDWLEWMEERRARAAGNGVRRGGLPLSTSAAASHASRQPPAGKRGHST